MSHRLNRRIFLRRTITTAMGVGMLGLGVRIPVIASGGAGRLEHFYEALTEGGASAVLAASLFHFGEFQIGEVKSYLRERGVVVR